MTSLTGTPVDSPSTAAISYHVLTGPEFDAALSGRWDKAQIVPRWLLSPRKNIKYYRPRSSLIREPDKRTMFLAVIPNDAENAVADEEAHLMKAVGVLELQVNPYDDSVVWLKYISVDPLFQRRGIAARLLSDMVAHLQSDPRVLSRSRPSEEGKLKVQAYISALLDKSRLAWTQSD